jgi:microcystin-dependent protein
MSAPFVAEIRMFGCNFAPTGWALCNGQLMPISQNTALFSLLGTMYGGDGKSTFALPDLQGSAPMFWGQSSTGTIYDEGQAAGSETVTLLQSEIPVHAHNFMASNSDGNSQGPDQQLMAGGVGGISMYATPGALVQLNPQALSIAGSSQPHNNLMPYLTVNFCIALQGIFPARG